MDEPRDWQAWRRAERRARIAAREALAPADRKARDAAIDRWLEQGLGALAGVTVGFCWPFAAEPEPRFAVRRWRARGSRAALPVVVAPRAPLAFREWWPGAPMDQGVYGIPYPVDTPALVPAAVLVPVNGFDPGGHRLGYGGGYFDRTLAALAPRPVSIGLGHEIARMDTIHPRAHDVPLDFIVTEAGIHARVDDTLQAVDPAEADTRVRHLFAERGLNRGTANERE